MWVKTKVNPSRPRARRISRAYPKRPIVYFRSRYHNDGISQIWRTCPEFWHSRRIITSYDDCNVIAWNTKSRRPLSQRLSFHIFIETLFGYAFRRRRRARSIICWLQYFPCDTAWRSRDIEIHLWFEFENVAIKLLIMCYRASTKTWKHIQ